MYEPKRSSDTQLALLKQAIENLEDQLKDRAYANNKRMEQLEYEVERLKSDRAKLSGGIIFVTAIGGVLLWMLTFGQNLLKAFGK